MSTFNLSNKKIDLSIVIINYNLAMEIENCLNSLLGEIDKSMHYEYEIIIVDNDSPDRGLLETEKKFKKDNIHFFYLEENLGFGKGCNFGFSKSSGKYLCFLNPDTLITEDIFSPIISLLQSDKSVGIIGPKQQVRPPFFDFSAGFYPNIVFEVVNLFGVGVFFEGLIMSFYTKFKRNKGLEVDWILGAAIFMKSELFQEINGFDKDYFMFSEEVDLCKRVSNKGFKIIYHPEYKIHHIGSVSGKKDYTLYTIRTYSSRLLYISKHYKGLYKSVMRFLIQLQLFSQIFIWTILFPINKQKSKQKIDAFFYLLKTKVKHEHWR